jgi:MarR family transcriptional regulator, organic hydroperoxide resistance regulator
MMVAKTQAKPAGLDPGPRDLKLLTVSRPELLVDASDAQFRTLLHRLLSFSRLLVGLCDGFGEFIGMTGVQYEIMMWVQRLQGSEGVTVGEVSNAMRQSGAFTTIETGKMVQKGLLDKFADLKDRRRVRMRVTEAGRNQMNGLAPYKRRINDALFASLKPNQLEELSATFAEILSDAEQAANLMEFILKQEHRPPIQRSI